MPPRPTQSVRSGSTYDELFHQWHPHSKFRLPPYWGIVSIQRLHDLVRMQHTVWARDLKQFGYLTHGLSSVPQSADSSANRELSNVDIGNSLRRLRQVAGSRLMRRPLPLCRGTIRRLKLGKLVVDTPNAK